jgi:sec-independent protein translocase protein TatA
MGDLFDSPWKLLIIAALIIVLFGARKLPDAARSLGKSMRILKTEVQGLHEDDEPAATAQASAQQAPAQPAAQIENKPPVDAQAHITQLQQQLDALKATAGNGAGTGSSTAEAQRTQQSG